MSSVLLHNNDKFTVKKKLKWFMFVVLLCVVVCIFNLWLFFYNLLFQFNNKKILCHVCFFVFFFSLCCKNSKYFKAEH